VHGILTFFKRLIGLYLQSLHYRFVTWSKPDTTSLLLGTLLDLSRSKSELVAENALLRQQLLILRRQVKRPACTKMDRMLLAFLSRLARTWKQVLFIVQPQTRLALASPRLQALLEIQVQSSSVSTETLRRDGVLDSGDGQGQPTLGSRADPGRITQAGDTRLQADHSAVHESRAHHQAMWADLEDLPPHSCPAGLGLRLPPGHRSLLPLVVRLLHGRTALAPSDPCRRDAIAHRRLDCAYRFGRPLPLVWGRSTSSGITIASLE
jgi:hypothetical protein